MSDYSHSMTVKASPEEVFEFVSKVQNLPKYLPTTKHAEPQQGERVRVQGTANGHQYDADGYLKADKANHKLEWGSDGETNYSGRLEIKPQGSDSSNVTVHLSLTPPPQMAKEMEQKEGGPDKAVQEGLVKALESIKNYLEGHGGKVEHSATQK